MHANLLMQAVVYLAASVVSVPIAKRLGLGSVLGYLIAGAVVGPYALSLVGAQEDVMAFAEFGVVILLFLIGLEVRPALLWSMRKTIFGLGGAQVVATAAAIAAVSIALGLEWKTAVAVGFVLAMSSTAIVLQTLDEKGLRQGPVGRAAFGVLLLQDLSIIPLFALLPLLAVAPVRLTSETAHSASLIADLPAWLQTLAVLGAVAAVIGVGRYAIQPLFRYIAQARLREIFTATALLIVVGVAVLMQSVGLSPALGAFLAGVVLAESEFRRELETDIEPFRGLLLGLFFITVGASIDFALVLRQPLMLIGLVLGLMTLKFVVMFGLALIGGATARAATAVAVALAQGGEFAFVLLTFTVGAGVIEPDLAALLTAAVALSMALTPLAMLGFEKTATLMDAALPDVSTAEPQFEADDAEPDIIIAGFGRFGQITGRLLQANGFRSTVLDADIEQIDLLRRFGRRVHYGDATRMDLLRAAGADRARMLIVALDDQEKTTELVERARQAFPDLTIIARAFDRRHAYDLLANGADAVERETFESALSMGVTALRSLGFRAHRAQRAADYFRRHDRRTFEELRPKWGQTEAYMLASRDAAQTMDRLLAADLERMRPGASDGWDPSGRDEDQREEVDGGPARAD
ncbi:MAG TPA: monovalent cation:proton antiporter-2 (CPA2) family protein [Caulobacter sp.]|nr:monovalent cation:proton antiporter-2 (CPA2) family protein [Caulobacter sp.]